MRDNEFEKRVQQKMEDLDLSPSAEVWPAIERCIRKEKKRKFIFWWPLLFLLGGGIAAGIIFNNKKEKNKPIAAIPKKENVIPSLPSKTAVPAIQPITKNNSAGDSVINNEEPVEKQLNNNRQKNNPEKVVIIIPTFRKKITNTETRIKNKRTRQPHMVNKDSKGRDKAKKEEKKPSVVTVTNSTDPVTIGGTEKINRRTGDSTGLITQPVQKTKSQGNEPVGGDSTAIAKQEPVPTTPQLTISPATDSSDVPENKKATPKKAKQWEWDIALSTGRSGVINGLNFFGGSLYTDVSNFQNGSGGNPLPVPGGPALISYSFSWSAGLYMKKVLSKKWALHAGLGYNYFSTKMITGNRVDSTRNINNSFSQGLRAGYFYRTGSSSTYTNQFHFLQLSADLSWKIFSGKKFKLAWENGLAYNRLLSSSMLHYDRSLPGYYKDNNLLERNQVFFSTGLSIPAWKQFVINPFASLGLTPLLKNADFSNTHYSNFGIRVKYLLNKK